MKEAIHRFGRKNHLVGIVSKPESSQSRAVVILNAGAVHKTGPCRLNVDLSKGFSQLGYLCLRFDLGGLGESQKADLESSYDQAVVADVQDAFDFLEEKFSINRFIVIGLCTGADLAYKAAKNDKRIEGMVWLDGYGYLTGKFHIHQFSKVLNKPRKLAGLLRKYVKAFKTKLNGKMLSNVEDVDNYIWRQPPKNVFSHTMKSLCENSDFRALFIYSGGATSYFNYQDQLKDGFPGQAWLNRITVVRIPEADHTFLIRRDREKMIESVKVWLESYFQES